MSGKAKYLGILVPKELKNEVFAETREIGIQDIVNECVVSFDGNYERSMDELQNALETEKLYVSVRIQDYKYIEYLAAKTGHPASRIIKVLLEKRYRTGSEKRS